MYLFLSHRTQSITAIDDVGEAILHLEECNWDLYVSYRYIYSWIIF